MSSIRVSPQNNIGNPIEIAIQRLPNGGGLPLPAYASGGAAGMDVVAAETLTLRPGARHAVATGFAMAIPAGYEVQVRPRSGLALKHGITCLNTPGTIDSDYRGEVKVILANLSEDNFDIKRGDRIAQLVPAPVQRATFAEVTTLDETERGAGGFGSTGVESDPVDETANAAGLASLSGIRLRRPGE
ncbi:dUTP diphosphatase [Sphingopyxis sp.]|uniref:dUTP diphosphatase n=1 Tax=Sphingopyxis sp. TaxID=1908224 RepID=UPI003FA7E3C6